MKLIQTEDGSYTAFNKQYQEKYHSISGAIEEAFEKHVNALKLKDGMKILDFCFGLGYNSIAATKDHQDLKVIGLENDKKILELMKTIKIPKMLEYEYNNFRNLAENLKIQDAQNNIIKILIGNALEKIDKLPNNYFDRVFFDPFSPKKQPEMWTEHIFQKVFNKMKPKAKLSTYSCAKQIRKNMISVGFKVIDGPIVGRKSPATIAIKRS